MSPDRAVQIQRTRTEIARMPVYRGLWEVIGDIKSEH
jgi:hypothetical protein